jgi:hypothetical protein
LSMQKLFKCATIQIPAGFAMSQIQGKNKTNKQKAVTEQILSMMEKFTERIGKLEKIIKK